MPITGIFTRRQPNINGFVFDAVLEESDELRTDVTQFPIEDGTIGNDHAVTQNQMFTMVVALSDNPVRALAAQASQAAVFQSLSDSGLAGGYVSALQSAAISAVSAGSSIIAGAAINTLDSSAAALAGLGASIANASYAAGQASTRSQSALQAIRQVQRNKTIFTLTTSRGTYPNCIITNTRQRTDVKNEQGLELIVELQQLRIMTTRRTSNLYDAIDAVPVQGDDTASAQAQLPTNRGLVEVTPLPPVGAIQATPF